MGPPCAQGSFPGFLVSLLRHSRGPMDYPSYTSAHPWPSPRRGLGSLASEQEASSPRGLPCSRDSCTDPWLHWPSPILSPLGREESFFKNRLEKDSLVWESLSSAVTIIKLPNLSKPQFLDLQNGDNSTHSPGGFQAEEKESNGPEALGSRLTSLEEPPTSSGARPPGPRPARLRPEPARAVT